MLIEFSVKNFKSIKEKVTLSMVATPDKEHPENTFEVRDRKLNLLKSIAIYGANASGKSNLIQSLNLMRRFVLYSVKEYQRGENIPVIPFKLDIESRNQPSEFEVAFIKDNERYIYGFSVDSNRVHEEWLTAARTSKPRLLFTRTSTSNYKFGDSWQGDREALQNKTRENALFLSVAVQFDNPTAKPVYDWFKNYFRSLSSIHMDEFIRTQFTIDLCEKDKTMMEKIAKMLREADLGIDGFEISRAKWDDLQKEERMPEEVKEAFQRLIDAINKISGTAGVDLETIPLKGQIKTIHKVFHKDKAIEDIYFDFESEESDGTQKYFSLIGPWLILLNQGGILVIDEFDTSLHPLLTQNLIELIHRSEVMKNPPQFIFTTHDCCLLDSKLFRRDQILFTEKNQHGATEAYSLWDYKNVRKGEDFQKGYLLGRYGAIPFIGDFKF